MLTKTHNYNPILSNELPDINNDSQAVKSKKEFDYYIRNYYEYLDTINKGGQVCFLTLSYNDEALKTFCGIPVVDYNDFRWLVRDSGLRSWCEQRNTSFKYFCTCEYGEGKGVRGVDNNPHFHVIFYINSINQHIPHISINDFANRICYYWQGRSFANLNSSTKYARLFVKGIVSASKKYGLELLSPSAIRYVCKYVTKDNVITKHRTKLMAAAYHRTMFKVSQNRELVKSILFNEFNDFQRDVIESYRQEFNLQPNEIYFNDIYECKKLYLDNLDKYVSSIHSKEFIKKHISSYVNQYIKNEIKPIIFNRFSPKVRISHGVGLTALDDVNFDEEKGKIKIALKDRFGYYNLPLYLYRYKYCDKIKVKHRSKEQYYYTYKMNDKGINLQLQRINDLLDLRKKKVNQFLSIYYSNPNSKLFDIKPEYCPFTIRQILQSISKFNQSDFVDKFVLYDTLFYRYKFNCQDFVYDAVNFDYEQEYYRLLESDIYDYNYLSDFDLDELERVKANNRNFVSYKFHPYFKKYYFFYDKFRKCLTQLDLYIDEQKKLETERKRQSKRVLNRVLNLY